VRNSEKYEEIKFELRSRQAESQAIRKQIHATSGLDRYNLWAKKRAYGSDTRYLLLAYAFLRGMPYRVCEPEGSSPPSTILIRRKASPHYPDEMIEWVVENADQIETQIEAWLKATPKAAQEAA
jgi:hypothetical protein